MKYWENGFYLEQNEDNTRTAITDENWQELLQGQSNGKIIVDNGSKYPILKDYIPTQQEINKQQYYNLVDWFNYEYSYKEQKFRRLITLGRYDDDGVDPQIKLTKLYQEAEEKRKQIQNLEKII